MTVKLNCWDCKKDFVDENLPPQFEGVQVLLCDFCTKQKKEREKSLMALIPRHPWPKSGYKFNIRKLDQ